MLHYVGILGIIVGRLADAELSRAFVVVVFLLTLGLYEFEDLCRNIQCLSTGRIPSVWFSCFSLYIYVIGIFIS